ncbi:hypothetical protein BCF11_4866 [Collimonas sp. PA-H2]|nr:hypothetical protein BCF11_4866 [Collimonas sp. PA-H2]
MESGNTESRFSDKIVMWLVLSHAAALLVGAVIHWRLTAI